MLRIPVVLCLALISCGVVIAGYPDGSTGNTVGTGDSSSNSFGYGYSGSFSGGSPANIPAPIFDFQQFLMGYLENINKYHQEFIKKGGGVFSYSYASSSPTGNAEASSSITFNGDNRLQSIATPAGQAAGAGAGAVIPPGGGSVIPSAAGGSTAFGGGGGYGGAYGGGFSGPGGVGQGSSIPNADPNAGTSGSVPNLFSRFGDQGIAFASGSVGPDGVQQTAAVYPENPNVPNVNTRFSGSGQPGGFRSVFTSSQSSTSTVNGKPHTQQQSSTTVNDNGKITTYTAKNP